MVGVQYLTCVTNSGNTVAFVPGDENNLERLVIITPERVIIRGSLGLAAQEYWEKISDGKSVREECFQSFQNLLYECNVWNKIREKLPGQIPNEGSRALWTLINDEFIESKGNACGDRHVFYRVTNLHDWNTRNRYSYVEGYFELGMIFLHLLSAGKLNRIMKIWEEGKDGSLPPKNYIRNMIDHLMDS